MSDRIEPMRIRFAETDDGPLHLHVYRPAAGRERLPALLDVHGGAWSHFDPSVDFYWCEALARRGYLVASAEFRLAPKHRWPTCLSDVRAAARFLRGHADTLGLDPKHIGVIGGSTGGHLATMLALWPDDPADPITPALDVADDAPAHVDAAIALWPILDVPGRYRMVRDTHFGALARHFAKRAAASGRAQPPPPTERLRRLANLRQRSPWAGDLLTAGLQRLTALAGRLAPTRAILYDALRRGHDNAFIDERHMQAACPTFRLQKTAPDKRPPLLLVLGDADTNTTVAMTQTFVDRYRTHGGQAEFVREPGLGHSFGNLPSRAADRLVQNIDDFLQRQRAGVAPDAGPG